MWSDSPYVVPKSSFAWPVSPPEAEPDSGPCVCVQFNADWQPYILGALQQLAQDTTWALGPGDSIETVQGRVNKLLDMFGVTQGCTPLPTPPPNPPEGYDWDCAIAGYIVNEVVRQAMQVAINQSLGIGGPQGLLYRVLDFLPWAAVWVPRVADGIDGLIVTIGLNEAFDWVTAQAEQALWDLIGCTVYNIVKTVHGFTAQSTQAIHDELVAIGGVNLPFLTAIADFILGLEEATLNDIAQAASQTSYDCSGCGGSGGPTTTNPPLANQYGIALKRGSTTIYNVRELEMESGTLAGTADDAQYTPPAPANTLEVLVDGTDLGAVASLNLESGTDITLVAGGSGSARDVSVNFSGSLAPSLELDDTSGGHLTGVSKLTFEDGTLGGTSGAATYTPPTATAGAAVQAAPNAPQGLTQNAWTNVGAEIAVTAGTYILSAAADILCSVGDAGAISVQIWDGSTARAVVDGYGVNGKDQSVVIPPTKVSLGACTLYLQVWTDSASASCESTSGEGISPATWMLAQLPGGGAQGPQGVQGPQGTPGGTMLAEAVADGTSSVLTVAVPIATTCRNLRFVIQGQSSAATGYLQAGLTLNGLGGTSYLWHDLYYLDTTIGGTSYTNEPSIFGGWFPPSDGNVWRGITDGLIADWASTVAYKHVTLQGGGESAAHGWFHQCSGACKNTAAVATLSVTLASGNWVDGSTLTLYEA